jgi:primosomal protein N' (replication factor Y)
VKVLDLKQYRSAMKGPLAIPLYEQIEKALAKDEQAILLYNRRGFASYMQCRQNGHIPQCPNCSVSLTYHKAKKQLRCHYCGYSEREPAVCRECGEAPMETMGSGTQKLEEDIEALFPGAGVLRMDFDTTSGKDAHSRILSKFGRKEADILVGTQIVGKGLDFPDVTVVGVINADTELAFPSFRAGERMYQLLSQVAGRSGRSGKKGVVFFQTWQPDHPAIRAAENHNYKAFARRELFYRKMLMYPPYSRIIRFTFKGKKEYHVQQVAQRFTECLIQAAGEGNPVLGPSPASILRIKGQFRWESLVKIDTSYGAKAITMLLDKTHKLFDSHKPNGASMVRVNVNVDALE